MGSDQSLITEESGTIPAIEAAMRKPPRGISQDLSLNFSVAKVIAIFTVVAGHWFTGTILWIPVTFGLFVFAFSSAYFTAKIYGVEVDRQRFWQKKLERLGLRFWVSLSFLTLILAIKGGAVFHWHTLIHFIGLSGVLNWFSIPNRSDLGAGLWFFTLLLLFYFTYPYLAKLSASKSSARVIAVIATVGAISLEQSIKVGHELWLTSLGFILGVVYGLHEPKFSARSVLLLAGLSCVCLLGLNVLSSYKQFNAILIAAASIFISLWLSKATLPQWSAAKMLAKFEGYLLEIFLIHTYLFVHVFGNSYQDFGVSAILIIIAAMVVKQVVVGMSSLIIDR